VKDKKKEDELFRFIVFTTSISSISWVDYISPIIKGKYGGVETCAQGNGTKCDDETIQLTLEHGKKLLDNL